MMYKGGDWETKIALDMLESVHFKMWTGPTSGSVWLSGENKLKQMKENTREPAYRYFAFVFEFKGPVVSRQTWNVILGK